LFIVSVLASRGGDNSVTSLAVDPAGLLRQSHEAMLGLNSLQAEMTTQWEGREYTYRVAWQNPDSFHVLSSYVVAHMQSGQETQVTDYGFAEAIAISDQVYNRQCEAEDEDCQPWEKDARGGLYVPAFAGQALDPWWTIELLGLISDTQVVGQEKVAGVDCVRIQGNANIMGAWIQSWRRAEELRGPLDWGEECTSIDSDAGVAEECHPTTLDEYIATYEYDLRKQDENPPRVEVWIGREDKLMRRLEFRTGLGEPPAGYFTFSRFDEVTIEPPK
jgi:hypothetical protein